MREHILETLIAEENDIGVLLLEGELIADSRFEPERILREWLDKGIRKVIVGCGNLKYLDSAGLSMLLGAMHRFRRNDGDLILADLNPSLNAIFEVTSMEKYFNIFSNLDEARKHFKQLTARKDHHAAHKDPAPADPGEEK